MSIILYSPATHELTMNFLNKLFNKKTGRESIIPEPRLPDSHDPDDSNDSDPFDD